MSNWIVANLNAAIDFFSDCMSKLYAILMINPITYGDGGVWDVVSRIYDVLIGPCLSIMMSIYLVNLIQETGDLIKFKRPGNLVWSFIIISFIVAVMTGGKYLLLLIFWIGRELMDKVCGMEGVDFLRLTWIELPDAITNATNNLSLGNGIIFWVVTLICALIVMVSCFGILFVVYGRLMKIYLHIAMAPVAISTCTSRATRQTFTAYVRSFVGVCIEGLVIIVVCMIFSAFANNFNFQNPTNEPQIGEVGEMASDEYLTEEQKQAIKDAMTVDDVEAFLSMTDEDEKTEYMNSLNIPGLPTINKKTLAVVEDYLRTNSGENRAKNAEMIWKYLAEMMFLYLLMAGMIKGADNWVHQKLAL